MANKKEQIDNIEQLEIMEEKFGINLCFVHNRNPQSCNP